MRSELIRLQHELAQRSRSVAACASVMALASCSAPPGAVLEDEGPGMFSGPLPGAGAPAPAAPAPLAPSATNTAPNAPPVANANPQPAGPAPSEQPASNGTPIDPGTPPPNGNNDNAGANSGAGGASMVPPASDLGAAGSSVDVGGAGGAAPIEPPTDGQEPPVVTPPPVENTPPETPTVTPPPVATGPDIPCPAGAFFCSGFENGFPADTQNIIGGGDIPNAFALDTAERNSGAQSLFLPTQPTIRFVYRVLAVPVTTQQFWARMFFRTDVAFGSSQSHEAIFGPSEGDLTQDNNQEGRRLELSEQFGYMLMNVNDTTPEPAVRRLLSANEWHCIEARYDGDAGQVEIFADGEQFINHDDPLFQVDFQTFRLGYMQFNGTSRNVWYDDVILSANRVGCD